MFCIFQIISPPHIHTTNRRKKMRCLTEKKINEKVFAKSNKLIRSNLLTTCDFNVSIFSNNFFYIDFNVLTAQNAKKAAP